MIKVINGKTYIIPDIEDIEKYINTSCVIINNRLVEDTGIFLGIERIDVTDRIFKRVIIKKSSYNNYWWVDQKQKGWNIAVLSDQGFTNKGQKNCLSCQCKTEMKRDFSTMEVREFCPRCRR